MIDLEQLKRLYQEMYELTVGECAKCRLPYSCCSRHHCELAKEWAQEEWSMELPPFNDAEIPYLSNQGCVIEPYLRPMCTFHTCEICSLGFKKDDNKWTDRYFDLRHSIDELEFERMVCNQEDRQTISPND